MAERLVGGMRLLCARAEERRHGVGGQRESPLAVDARQGRS